MSFFYLFYHSQRSNYNEFQNRKRSICSSEARFDGLNHWLVRNEGNKRRNCKECSLKGKADLKSVYSCEKCRIPLHVDCFKERIH